MTTIEASGMAVGLPDGQMGNSEVGHTNMGAGRIVYQQLTLITKSIRDGEMLKNPVLVKNMKAAIDAGKAIHLMGLVGTGGVHSHADHWFGVLEMASRWGQRKSTSTASPMAATPTPTPARASLRPAGQAGRAGHRQDRQRLRPLLRHGPRQQLGPRGEGLRYLRLRRGQPRRQRAGAIEHPMPTTRPTSSFCPASPARAAACRTATPSSS